MSKLHLKIDYSTLSAFKKCPTYSKLAYIDGLQLRDASADALQFGELFHLGLEFLHQTTNPHPEGLDKEIEYLISGEPPSPNATGAIGVYHEIASCAAISGLSSKPADEKRSLAHLLRLLHEYSKIYLPEKPFLHYELNHTARLYEDSGIIIDYCGTMDGLCDPKTIFETKTTSYLNKTFLDRMNPNAQADGYIFLAHEWLLAHAIPAPPYEEMRVIFNGISTAGYGKSYGAVTSNPSSWLINKEPSKLFLRSETSRTAQQILQWKEETIHWAKLLLDEYTREKINFLPAFPKGDTPTCCTQYNSTCPYNSLCTAATPQLEKTLRDASFITKPWKNFQITLNYTGK